MASFETRTLNCRAFNSRAYFEERRQCVAANVSQSATRQLDGCRLESDEVNVPDKFSYRLSTKVTAANPLTVENVRPLSIRFLILTNCCLEDTFWEIRRLKVAGGTLAAYANAAEAKLTGGACQP